MRRDSPGECIHGSRELSPAFALAARRSPSSFGIPQIILQAHHLTCDLVRKVPGYPLAIEPESFSVIKNPVMMAALLRDMMPEISAKAGADRVRAEFRQSARFGGGLHQGNAGTNN